MSTTNATTPISEYVKSYIRRNDLSKSYIDSLAQRVKVFESWRGEPIRLQDLNDDLVNDWLTALKGRTYTPRTIRHYRSAILTIWRAAFDERILDDPPRYVRKVKVPRKPPEAWTIKEVRRLLLATEFLPGVVPHTMIRRSDWFGLFVRLAWCTGLRLSDLLALRASQVDPDGILRLSQEKTGEPIALRLSAECVAAAKKITNGGKLLPWPGNRRQVLKWFSKLVKMAGVRPGTTRWLRRSAASYVEKAQSGAARLLLGHKTPGLAERHYIDPSIAGKLPPSPPEL